ncbi:MAG: HD domain-containing protein [Selenomonadaceae bacterium]
MKGLLEQMHDWMHDYMKSFYNEDKEIQKGILIKEEHTGYVAKISRELAENLDMNVHDCMLAEMMGLFHDVGRFRQFTLYKTFNDSLSENHALLGIKVLKEQSFIESLNAKDRDLLLFAIGNHNAKSIENTENERKLLFARLLRDADKLDIYRVLSPFLQPSDGTGCSPDFVHKFVMGEQCDYSQIRTVDDRKLVRLMWIYDINFAWTLHQVIDRGYLKRIVAFLPKELLIQQGIKRLYKHIAVKLQTKDEVKFSKDRAGDF